MIDVRIIGEEYKDKDFTGRQYCEEKGIELFYNKKRPLFFFYRFKKENFEVEKAKAVVKKLVLLKTVELNFTYMN